MTNMMTNLYLKSDYMRNLESLFMTSLINNVFLIAHQKSDITVVNSIECLKIGLKTVSKKYIVILIIRIILEHLTNSLYKFTSSSNALAQILTYLPASSPT